MNIVLKQIIREYNIEALDDVEKVRSSFKMMAPNMIEECEMACAFAKIQGASSIALLENEISEEHAKTMKRLAYEFQICCGFSKIQAEYVCGEFYYAILGKSFEYDEDTAGEFLDDELDSQEIALHGVQSDKLRTKKHFADPFSTYEKHVNLRPVLGLLLVVFIVLGFLKIKAWISSREWSMPKFFSSRKEVDLVETPAVAASNDSSAEVEEYYPIIVDQCYLCELVDNLVYSSIYGEYNDNGSPSTIYSPMEDIAIGEWRTVSSNVLENSFKFWVGGTIGNKEEIEYSLENYNYNYGYFYIECGEYSNGRCEMDNSMNVSIYGDGSRLYSVNITDTTCPVFIELPIEDVKELRIEVSSESTRYGECIIQVVVGESR